MEVEVVEVPVVCSIVQGMRVHSWAECREEHTLVEVEVGSRVVVEGVAPGAGSTLVDNSLVCMLVNMQLGKELGMSTDFVSQALLETRAQLVQAGQELHLEVVVAAVDQHLEEEKHSYSVI